MGRHLRVGDVEIRHAVTRPTGLQIHQISVGDLEPFILLVLPEAEAYLGIGRIDEQLRCLGWSSLADYRHLLSLILARLNPLLGIYRCRRLFLRLQADQALGARIEGLRPPAFHSVYSFLRLQTSLHSLAERCSGCVLPASLSFEDMLEPVGRDARGWNTLPPFPDWFEPLFRRIFHPGTDPEISSAPTFQLAVLELAMAAGWQRPRFSVLVHHPSPASHGCSRPADAETDLPKSVDASPLGFVLSRSLNLRQGEISFVGLLPDRRGRSGLAELLIRRALEPLEARGIRDVISIVAVENRRSMTFFTRKLNFIPVISEFVWKREIPDR